MSAARFVGARELANKSNILLHDVNTLGQTCYITEGGKAKAVLLDIHRYHALMDLIEDTENFRDFGHPEKARHDVSVHTILSRSSRRK